MKKQIPYGTQSISSEDIKAVSEVLKSDFLTQGPQVEIFENKVRNIVALILHYPRIAQQALFI